MTAFFVPFVEAEKQEEAYQEMARFVGCAPLPFGERVYSMTWRHDGVVWKATVGETLSGLETVETGRGRNRRCQEVSRHTNDTVIAIFPGRPGKVVHDNKSKYWDMPIFTGEPQHILRFEVA